MHGLCWRHAGFGEYPNPDVAAFVMQIGESSVPTRMAVAVIGLRSADHCPSVWAEKMVETHGLTKRYGTGIIAVDALDQSVYRGRGVRIPSARTEPARRQHPPSALGPSSGRRPKCKGCRCSPERRRRWSKVGAIVGRPAFYPVPVGYDNLRLLAMYCGVAASRVDATWRRVDLAPRAHH